MVINLWLILQATLNAAGFSDSFFSSCSITDWVYASYLIAAGFSEFFSLPVISQIESIGSGQVEGGRGVGAGGKLKVG